MTVQRPIVMLKGGEFFFHELPIYVNRAVETFDMIEHSHDFLEVSYVGEGSGTHHTGEASASVARGDIFLIPVGVSHVFRPSSVSKEKPLIVYNCIFSVEAFDRLLAAFPGGGPVRELLSATKLRRYEDRHGEFHRLFQQLHYEYAASRPGREAALYLGVLDLLLYLHRTDAEPETEDVSVPSGLDAALRYLHTRFDEPVSLARMAALAGVGERQFHRLFTKYTGMTLTEYAQTVRVNEACRLLRTTDRKVGDIAASVGYHDISYFNALFKRIAGVTPRDYRQRR